VITCDRDEKCGYNVSFNLISVGSAQQKDFKKENAYHIKQIQRANRKKQQEATAGEPVKAVYKPDKFEHVESKVAQEMKVLSYYYIVECLFTIFCSLAESKSLKKLQFELKIEKSFFNLGNL